ncbi:amidohydrolase family protein [Streptomyces sioyaensis]|uniref:Amidohydrolase n=1 Tax=Streptomyces sioyaensis TaxID=67364 RepID=A0A4V1NQ52_9ACTN|nr:amidohydrolase family protein [Streptomyces sioyaensis]MBM4792744.1 amidohydrolase family protein [Streptomyces sioyaensis]RXS67110.1 amidohydrolase [Streptomyces sioyaensis]
MPLIAIEEHWIMPDVTSGLRAVLQPDESLAFNEMGDNQERLEDLGAGRIAAMDAQGIDVSVLALTPPGVQPLPPREALALSRAANDMAAAAVARHPTRFRSLSTLPMSSPKDVGGELERAAGMGHVGTMVYGRSGDLFLDDPAYDDFFCAASELGQPVFIHPQLPSTAVRDASFRGFDRMTDLALATFGWGWHLDAAIAVLRLMLRGTFDRHPDLQVVLGHWGEMLLFWLDRADSLSRIAGLERSISDYVRSNSYITTSGMLNPAFLQHALSVTSVDRLIFSTDYPFQQPTREEIDAFLKHFSSDAERKQFSSANAASLYGIAV